MMGALAVNKKKYNELDDIIKQEFKEKSDKLFIIREKLSRLIDEDTASFNELMKSFKLPKETEEEKRFRSEEIQRTTLYATEIPFEVAKTSLEAMEQFPFFSKYGNQNAITDLGVGAMLLEAGIRGAILNVKVNLGGLKDESKVERFREGYEKMEEEAITLKEAIMDYVDKKIK
jgi:formiminotetrahydrofolate cyclodeaminase